MVANSEATPLLRSDPSPGEVGGHQGAARPWHRAVILVILLSVVADVGGSMIHTPEVRLLEMSLCRDYYRRNDPSAIGPPPLSYVDEILCKRQEIQASLAYLRALKSLFSTIPGIILTLPYGRLAEKIGRKPVLLAGVLGQLLAYSWTLFTCYFHQSLPTSVVLLSSVFNIIGGGTRVVTAIMNTMVADVTPENTKTTIFYLNGAVLLIAEMVAAPIGSWLLSKDLWLPFKFSTPILLSSFIVISFMPETLSTPAPIRGEDSEQDSDAGRVTDRGTDFDTPEAFEMKRRLRSLAAALNETLRTLNPFAMPRQVTIWLCIIFLTGFASTSASLFIQYVSNLLHWPISSVGYLASVKAFVTLGVLVLLAFLTHLSRRHGAAQSLQLDTWVTRASLVCLGVGDATVGLGRGAAAVIAGSVISSVGSGVGQTLRGILASYATVDATPTAQLFASAALVELLAQLSGGLVFAWLFDRGLRLPSVWGIGLLYYTSAGLYFANVLLSFTLSTARTEQA